MYEKENKVQLGKYCVILPTAKVKSEIGNTGNNVFNEYENFQEWRCHNAANALVIFRRSILVLIRITHSIAVSTVEYLRILFVEYYKIKLHRFSGKVSCL